nr:hypothetical protein [Tanacetum cinerariifolium]
MIKEPSIKKYAWTTKLEETARKEACWPEKSRSWSDGNCGFRAVALGLGLQKDQWPRIRSDLAPQSDSHETIVVAHVNGNHYIRVALWEGFPLPLTHPLWITYKSDIASGWEDKF